MQKTIFVVDDNDMSLSMANEALMRDYRVMTLPSAARMFMFLGKIRPDLILLDIEMPEMDGFQALAKLKEDAAYSDIPVIFLTSMTDPKVEARGFEMGVVDFIQKPFTWPVLRNRIKTHLQIDELIRERTKKLEDKTKQLQEQLSNSSMTDRYDNSTALRLLLDTDHHCCILFGDKYNVIDCNHSAVEMMGFADKQEMITGFIDRMEKATPEDQSNGEPSVMPRERLDAAAVNGEVRFENEFIINNELRTIDVSLKKIPYGDSYAIVAYILDTTELHNREMELLHTRILNELQLTKLELVIKATGIGLWDMVVIENDVFNPNNPFTWSDEFRHLLGFEDENDFPNLMGSFTERLHPDDLEPTNAALLAHLLDKTGKTPYNTQYRAKKKNGEYGYYHATGETIRDKKGNPIRVCGAIMDITDVKNTIAKMQKLKDEAEQANKSKSAFLSTMSHEIRTPMNAILGIAEILLQNESIAPDVRASVEKIHTSGDMLLGIINDILDLSKIEAGKLELFEDVYEIASLISDTAQLNMMRIGSKQIRFELEIDETVPERIIGDELRVKQILNNLLSNAFKYTNKGKVTLELKKETSESDDRVVLVFTITDTGQGMSKEQVDTLFDEYTRFNQESNRKTEGTGLGMSITRNLIQIMGGTIAVESELGKGSAFTVRLPQGKAGDKMLGREMVENMHQFRTISRAQMRRVQITRDPMPYGSVLIVDDVEMNIFVARGLLSPYQLKIDAAQSGTEAIRKIEKGNVYDIIFMDHMMPDMDGVEATAKIREMGYNQPVVALTANAVAGQSDFFMNNGFDDFISKPIDIRQLNNVLNKLIRDKQPPEVIEEARRISGNLFDEDTGADNIAITPQIAAIFIRDAVKTISVLSMIAERQGSYSKEDLRAFVIHTHGIKSALANIGKTGLSADALRLEMLGRDGNVKAIAAETPEFLRALREIVEEFSQDDEFDDTADENPVFIREKLLSIADACESFDSKSADAAIKELRDTTCSKTTREKLDIIAEHLLHSDFDEASAIASEYAGTLPADCPAANPIETAVISGLDIKSGLEKFGGDAETYIRILRSYVTGTRKALKAVKEVNKENLSGYRLAVHSIKGTSLDIFADEAGNLAAELEEAAKKEDTDYIKKHNPRLTELAEKLIGDIEDMLDAAEEKSEKELRDTPDKEVLAELKKAAEIYDIDSVNKAISGLEAYRYETDGGLVKWLSENAAAMNFTAIEERLSEYL